jgi:hypothetical protein
MPSKTKAAIAAETALPSIPKELIRQFVICPKSAEAVKAASMAFKKALIERALGVELSHHLDYPPGCAKSDEVRFSAHVRIAAAGMCFGRRVKGRRSVAATVQKPIRAASAIATREATIPAESVRRCAPWSG